MALRIENESFTNNISDRFEIAQQGRAVPDEALTVQVLVRNNIIDAAKTIDSNIADSREKSLALTHLEEALMWAGKAIFKAGPIEAELPGVVFSDGEGLFQ